MIGYGRNFCIRTAGQNFDISDELSEYRHAPIFRHRWNQSAAPPAMTARTMSTCEHVHGAADMSQLMHSDVGWEVYLMTKKISSFDVITNRQVSTLDLQASQDASGGSILQRCLSTW